MPAESSSSELTADQLASLNEYAIQLKQEVIAPRVWLRRHPRINASDAFRAQLWGHYKLEYPPPTVSGFTIIDVLGEGGMGRVYLAFDNHLKREVAIKELTAELKRDAPFRERFRLEGQYLARLKHPHIVEVYQFLSHDGREFMVMEYVDRGSLADRLVHGRPEEPRAAARWVSKIARAIAHAHAEGIIHRDLKPGNILFDKHGEPKVSDFGLAKNLLDSTDRTKGAAVGTPRYMAPEQLDGKTPLPATDIWALGVVLYQLLAGRLPFDNANEICSAEPPSIDRTVPLELISICRKCLCKDPKDRYQRAEDLANALDGQAPSDTTVSFAVAAPANLRRHRIGIYLGILALAMLVLATLVGFAFLRGPTPRRMDAVHSGYCSSIVFAPDGKRAYSESGGAEIFVWDLQRGIKEVSKLHGLEQPSADESGSIAISGDGKWLAASAVNHPPLSNRFAIEFFDAASLNQIPAIVNANRVGPSFVFSPDNAKLASADLGVAIRVQLTPAHLVIYNVDAAKSRRSLALESLPAHLAYSPNGKTLAVGCEDGKIGLWNVDELRKFGDLIGHAGAVDQLRFADDPYLYSVSTSDMSLRVWNLKTAKVEQQTVLKDREAKISCAAMWSGGRVLTGHIDGAVCLWDINSGTQLYRFRHSGIGVTAVAIGPDGTKGLCALSDRSVYLHQFPTPEIHN